jgi:peptidoglycan/LPS O-acetylase OafA/YrhL
MQSALRLTHPQAAPASGPRALRPDIEGLRALAVLAVIINHVTPQQLRGGFTGVDIFFVISGYLIGRRLLEDVRAGRFSFRGFYARRARRIFPSLIVVLAATAGCGWLILAPREFASLCRHVVAAALFSNNFLLWSESGYFDAPALDKPLLHLWSLGIEEQFYLLIPLLLWLGSRGRSVSARWVAWLTLASLMWNDLRPDPSFYLPETRFWELGSGVLLGRIALGVTDVKSLAGGANPQPRRLLEWVTAGALLVLTAVLALTAQLRVLSPTLMTGLLLTLLLGVLLIALPRVPGSQVWQRLLELRRTHESRLRGVSACAGIACIGASLFGITSPGWPGPQTMLPVLGTALVIAAGPTTFGNGLLGCRPLAYIGGISYPLYLWHWPLLVYWRMYEPRLTGSEYLLPMTAAFLLACLTRYLVEDPVRFGHLARRPVRKAPVWSLAAGLLAMGLVGVSVIASHGDPGRFTPTVDAIAGWSVPDEDAPWRVYRCYFYPNDHRPYAPECTPSRRPGVPQVLLWGDSHAAELYVGLEDLQHQDGFDIVQWTAAGCAPTRSPLGEEYRSCAQRRILALQELPRIAPDTVILAGGWVPYMETGSSPEAILGAIDDDLRWLRRIGVRHVVLFGPGPTWNVSLPVDLFRYMSLHRAKRIPERLGATLPAVRRLDAAMAAHAATWGASYVSILQRFCDARGCRTLAEPEAGKDGRPNLLFRDRDHLTVSGTRLLIESAARDIFPNPATGAGDDGKSTPEAN